MKNIFLLLLFILGISSTIKAQNSNIDSLNQLLKDLKKDTTYIDRLLEIANDFYFSKPEIALEYSKQALYLSRQLHYEIRELSALSTMGESQRFLGDYPGALKTQFEALALSRKIKNINLEAASLGFIGITYVEFNEYRLGLQHLFRANEIYQQLPISPRSIFSLSNIGNAYSLLKLEDSALYFQRLAYENIIKVNHPQLTTVILIRMGNVYHSLSKPDSALYFYIRALSNSKLTNEKVNYGKVHKKIAEIFESTHQYDSSASYAHRAFAEAENTGQKLEIMESADLLSRLYQVSRNIDSAFYYEGIVSAMKDSLFGPHRFKQLQLLMLEQQEHQQKIIQAQEHFRTKINYGILLSILGVMILFGIILYNNNRHKQKANKVLEKTLLDLKSTQAQLIQSEKMASLGELTAGIAHEIQNPLNFVNNFAEINKELLDEIEEIRRRSLEASGGARDELTESSILRTINENQDKIRHHGQRASSIVKGMLEHSRTSSGIKEPADINKLCDEFVRLSYQGLRAKDKEFNCEYKLDLDPNMPLVNVVSQDIGRVILNVINNAFQACDEKRRKGPAASGEEGSQLDYKPVVTVNTKYVAPLRRCEIFISDNGPGIPDKIKDKIFQPFFTTKPTGKGTGLGLSLAYDIIKAHGGDIKVVSKEGEARPSRLFSGDPVGQGTEFIINLPILTI